MQTGLYATTTGCFHNGVPLPSSAKALAHLFGEAGYRTGYIGKWHLADKDVIEAVAPEQRGGYEYWLASNILECTSGPYRTILYDDEERPVELPGYRVDALTDAAIRYIDANMGEPFYLFLSFLEPHHQNQTDSYPAPDGYAERYAGRWMPSDLAVLGGSAHEHLAGYCGMIKRLDEALGRLLDHLKSLGLEDDTIVLFTSDHGCHFRTRNKYYKQSPHDASIRVPTALQGSKFWGGGEVRELVNLVDLAPTLLDAVGLPVPKGMQGRSILPLLRGEREGWPEEVFVQFSNRSKIGRAVRTHRWKYSVSARGKDLQQDYASERYIEEHLYDLLADPYELENLVGLESHREVKKAMRQRLVRRMVETGEREPEIAVQNVKTALSASPDEIEAKNQRLQRRVKRLERELRRRRRQARKVKKARSWRLLHGLARVRAKIFSKKTKSTE